MIPRARNVFVGYERIFRRQDIYMHLGLLQYLRRSAVLLSCLLITQLSRNLPISQIRSVVSLFSLEAKFQSQLESSSTTILPILSTISSFCVRSSHLRFLPGLIWGDLGSGNFPLPIAKRNVC